MSLWFRTAPAPLPPPPPSFNDLLAARALTEGVDWLATDDTALAEVLDSAVNELLQQRQPENCSPTKAPEAVAEMDREPETSSGEAEEPGPRLERASHPWWKFIAASRSVAAPEAVAAPAAQPEPVMSAAPQQGSHPEAGEPAAPHHQHAPTREELASLSKPSPLGLFWASLVRTLEPLGKLTRGLTAAAARPGRTLRVVETVALGEKRFAAVLEVQGHRFLVGGGSGNVALLAQLDGQAEAEPATPGACRS